jgi:hypothetical protein
VAYFYISANDRATCDVANLTKSLVAQLYGCRPDTPEALLDLGEYRFTSGGPPQSKLEKALRLALGDFTETLIIIDGLDECPSVKDRGSGLAQRRILLELLATMREWEVANLHLMVTSRREQDINDKLERIIKDPQSQALSLGSEGLASSVSNDIGLFIDKELTQGIFERIGSDLKSMIKDCLVEKSDGVYASCAPWRC